MRYRKLDENGDMLAFSKGGAVEGIEAVASAIRSRLLSMRGEWWETPEEGVPFDYLVGHVSGDRLALADAFIKERIVKTEGVTGISSFASKIEGKKRTISVVVDTLYGSTGLEVSA